MGLVTMKLPPQAITCLALAALTCVQVRAAVTFVDVEPDQFVTTPRAGPGYISQYDIDFNSDGTREVRIYVSASATIGFNALTPIGTRVTGVPGNPGLFFAYPAIAGNLIGPAPLGPSAWVSDSLTGVNLGACVGFGDGTSCVGYFTNFFVGYLPVEFTLSDGMHYGMVEIEGIYGNGRVRSYAWETTPNTPIIAGSVPEPGRIGVFLLAGLLWTRRRARKRARD